MDEDRFAQIEEQAAHFKKLGKRSGEWATGEESFCGPDGDLYELVAETRRLRDALRLACAEVDAHLATFGDRMAGDEYEHLSAVRRHTANQDLGQTLDEIYERDPATRPSEEAVAHAGVKLGLQTDKATSLDLSDDERDALLMLLHLPRSEDCGLTDTERGLLLTIQNRLHEPDS